MKNKTITLFKVKTYELRYENYYGRKILSLWKDRLDMDKQKVLWWKQLSK